ncbi:MAG: hypothetical protein MJZ23_05840 [Paludibacteraceae bacterium]|nr:hypothetical protein [Paludibacteraceae bacterium]
MASAFAQSQIINGGSGHAVALCGKGQIFAWGQNKSNSLCLADEGADSIVAVPSLVNTGNITFTQVNGGSGDHSVALSCWGTVYCWGANDNGQCGEAPSKYSSGKMPIPVPKGETEGYNLDGTVGGDYLGNVKMVAATSGASLALLNDGCCVYWGGTDKRMPGSAFVEDSETPKYIVDENGDRLKNIIFVAGGDNGVMLIVGDSKDAKVGTLYSMGAYNGRGGDVHSKSCYPAPVEIGDGSGTKSSGEYLTNVKTCAYSDAGAMAVDADGQVYAWGNNGWWGVCGLTSMYPASSITYAEKVTSGEQKERTGEAFLTNVIQVIGGNGSATALAKDGSVLYWGSNTGAKKGGTSGGVIPNSDYATTQNTTMVGPVFANYCAGEHGNEKETRIDDAVAIGGGDLFGFVIDKAGDYYVWGTTEVPGGLGNAGTLGTGNVAEISTCLKKIEMPCETQDRYPEADLRGPRYKCPGSSDTLDCGFEPYYGTEGEYFFRWSKNGVVLNSTANILGQKPMSDAFNRPSIVVDEPGVYRVDVMYFGTNLPCDMNFDASAEVEVIDYALPIDTIWPTVECYPEGNVNKANLFVSFMVNDMYHKKGERTTWDIYESQFGDDKLATVEAEVGEKVEGWVFDTERTFLEDTTITLWIKDVTKKSDYLVKNDAVTSGSGVSSLDFEDFNSSNCSFLTFSTNSTIELGTFDMTLRTLSNLITSDAKLTASVYKTEKNTGGHDLVYVPSEKIAETTANVTVSDIQTVTVDFGGVTLPASSKGSVYMVVVTIESSDPLYALSKKVENDEVMNGSVTLIEGGKSDLGKLPTTYTTPDNKFSIFNLKLSALSDYSCGRVPICTNYVVPNLTSATAVLADDANKLVDVYSVNGVCLRRQVPMANALNGLRRGAYVVNGKTCYVNK